MFKFINVVLVINLILSSFLVGCTTKVIKNTDNNSIYEQLKIGDSINLHLRNGTNLKGTLIALPGEGADDGYIKISRREIFRKKTEVIRLVDVVQIDRYPPAAVELAGCCIVPIGLYVLAVVYFSKIGSIPH